MNIQIRILTNDASVTRIGVKVAALRHICGVYEKIVFFDFFEVFECAGKLSSFAGFYVFGTVHLNSKP